MSIVTFVHNVACLTKTCRVWCSGGRLSKAFSSGFSCPPGRAPLNGRSYHPSEQDLSMHECFEYYENPVR